MKFFFSIVCTLIAGLLIISCEKPGIEQNESHWSEDVIIPDNQIWYKTTDDNPVEYTGFSEEEIVSHSYSDGRGVIEFKNAVKELPAKAFTKGCFKLCRVRLPKTIQQIGDEAFYNCMFLEALPLPRA